MIAPPLYELQVFLSVARCGTTVDAAAELNVSQSAVSQTLTRLEQSLQKSLFLRTGRRLELTAAGISLRDALEGPLGRLQAALAAVRRPG